MTEKISEQRVIFRLIQISTAAAQAIVLIIILFPQAAFSTDQRPILIGLNADMSSADAESGQAIQRGALMAIREINSQGGVLDRPLKLRVLDHRRNPARGRINVARLADDPDTAAILGGKHTPVILAELETIHKHKIPYLVPWAAGTQVIENSYTPSYVFRVSIRDELAGGFMAQYAAGRRFKAPALVLEQTGWGRSNQEALTRGLASHGIMPVHVEWFNWGEVRFTGCFERLKASGADVLFFVGNSPDGVNFIKALQENPHMADIPVISHWGIAGGDFIQPLGPDLDRTDLTFIQTFSFLDPPFPDRAARVAGLYLDMFPDTEAIEDIKAPTGVAHAYDLVHLLAMAMEQAGSTDRKEIRNALENLPLYRGLVKNYHPAFTPDRHDALDPGDFCMARFQGQTIVPVYP